MVVVLVVVVVVVGEELYGELRRSVPARRGRVVTSSAAVFVWGAR
jgi:hypothetical protein